ncbi:MAG: hypothetical protein JWQ90_1326, partial [Hydrocarboniphaga sp.]|nr:hypothetical protein [Hydrocarboniphaga sp.]
SLTAIVRLRASIAVKDRSYSWGMEPRFVLLSRSLAVP